MSNYPHVFPRAELKAEAKKMMRPNWGTIFLVTLIYLIFMGIDSYTYTRYLPETSIATNVDAYSYTVSGAAGMYATYVGDQMDIGRMLLGGLIAFISALLIQGVLSYCYTAFFIRMAERKGEKLTFTTFVEGFTDAIKAALAYIWQNLWVVIWGLTVLPGLALAMLGAFTVGSDGLMSFLMLLGVFLMIAAAILIVMVALRYVFMYQVIADGRGKIGARQSMRYSIAIVKNHLGDVFFLSLSFIPWLLLGTFSFGLAFLYVMPYMEATYALSYQWLRDDAFREGRLEPSALGYVKQGAATTNDASVAQMAAPVASPEVPRAQAAPVEDVSTVETTPVQDVASASNVVEEEATTVSDSVCEKKEGEE